MNINEYYVIITSHFLFSLRLTNYSVKLIFKHYLYFNQLNFFNLKNNIINQSFKKC